MAKITRQYHKTFGGSGSSDNFAKFGSLVAGSPLKSKDIATIQALPAWDNGFQDAIYGANKDILLEDLNAFCFEHSRQIAYLFQAGLAEWDSSTEYSKGSFVQRTSAGDATGQVYLSLIDSNTGNAPPAAASNANWLWVNPPVPIVGASATLNTIPKVSNLSPTTGVPGSVALADSAIIDDGSTVGISLPLKFPDDTQQATAAAPITAQTDVTAIRAVGIVYHNTNLRPIFVGVAISMAPGQSMTAYADAAATPTTQVANCGNNTNPSEYSTLFFIVLPGHYYKLVGGAGFSSWIEWS